MIVLRALPSAVSLSGSPSVGFMATWEQNASEYKNLGLDRTDEISILFVPEWAALEIWEHVFQQKYVGNAGAVGLLELRRGHNIHEVTVGSSESDFLYLRDHFVEFIENKCALTLGLFIDQVRDSPAEVSIPFSIPPRVSITVPKVKK